MENYELFLKPGMAAVLGPPGTGKTTFLKNLLQYYAEHYDINKVIITSFSRNAAKELKGRIQEISEQNIGTLHSFAYAALQHPKLVETKMHEWNEKNPNMSIAKMTNGEINTQGEKLLNKLDILRAKLVPKDEWPKDIIYFEKKWTEFKFETQTMDFTDLIEGALKNTTTHYARPNLIICDESQDSTPLQLQLLTHWGKGISHGLIFAADDDQSIYEFNGVNVNYFLNNIINHCNYSIILPQSYRVPFKAKRLADKIINNVKNKVEKEYLPKKDENGEIIEGEVKKINFTYNQPEKLFQIINREAENNSIVILGSCGYMLNKTITYMKNNGIPFYNPYKVEQKNWNPLYSSKAEYFNDERNSEITTTEIVISFLNSSTDDSWHIDDLLIWAKNVKVGKNSLKRIKGNKGIKMLEEQYNSLSEEDKLSSFEIIHQIFEEAAIQPILTRDLDWLRENIKGQRKDPLIYIYRVLNKYGKEGLIKSPKIIISTIHGFKGNEADVVFLFPDISPQTAKESYKRVEMDALRRLFYVATTRTKKKLFITKPATNTFFKELS